MGERERERERERGIGRERMYTYTYLFKNALHINIVRGTQCTVCSVCSEWFPVTTVFSCMQLQFLFELPSRLTKCMEMGFYAQAVK